MLLQTFEVALNGVTNIRHCFVTSFPLRDAAGQGWAFGDKHAVFIRFNRDAKFHIASLAIAGAVRNAESLCRIRNCRPLIRFRSCLRPTSAWHEGQHFPLLDDVDLTNGTAYRAITNRHIYAVAANAS